MENTNIEWADHTFNPWVGCTKVSDGCKYCYAENMMSKRFKKVQWGPGGTRIRTKTWGEPLRWNKQEWAECTHCGWRGHEFIVYCPSCGDNSLQPTRARVFCASLADVFEDKPDQRMEMNNWRRNLIELIHITPNLDWLLLTKRPENILGWIPNKRMTGYTLSNINFGVSVEDQEQANERVPLLVELKTMWEFTGMLFLSCEPLLGMIDLSRWLTQIGWVIVGGESGPNARPAKIEWVRGIRDQCQAAEVPFLFKQWGEYSPIRATPIGFPFEPQRVGKKAAGRVLDGQIWNQFPILRIGENHV